MWNLVVLFAIVWVFGALCFLKLLLKFCSTDCIFPWLTAVKGRNLPPGSMGLPVIGETIDFFRSNQSFDVPPFIQKRKKRYGSLFRTSLVGRPVVVSTDPDVNQFIFQQEGRLFQSWYPDTFTKVFGEENVGSQHGHMYKHLRNMVLTLVGADNLKQNLLSEFQDFLYLRTSDWHDRLVEFKDATASILFDFTAKKLISYDPNPKGAGSLRRNFEAFIQGLISFPLPLPGTAYHACLKGRRNAMAMMNEMLKERTANGANRHSDFFDYVIAEMEKPGSFITKEIALDLMFVLLFASFETTSLALTVAVKFLTDNQAALDEVTKEHEAILAEKQGHTSKLTWEEYKSMSFTFCVVNEAIRLANIVPGMFRKAMKDVTVKGYTIPQGWAVMACPTAIHLDPQQYPDPVAFNPWRWQKIKNNSGTTAKHFIPFGGGMRFCVGTDFTKLAMALFLHCLVTRYRWEVVKGGEIRRTPGLSFPSGLHLRMYSKSVKRSD